MEKHSLSRRQAPASGGHLRENNISALPGISLPKGGGAIRSIDEQFTANPANGAASFSIPLPVAAARGFTPAIGLSYNSGNGNGPFGLGWQLDIPSIARKTDQQLPSYDDGEDGDTFQVSGADLVPLLKQTGNQWQPVSAERTIEGEGMYHVRFFRPRMEGAFSRIELWQQKENGHTYWRTISADNITTIYGRSENARIADPFNPSRISQWLIERSYDDKGHLIEYEYKKENSQGINAHVHTKNRLAPDGSLLYTNTYLKRVHYGNKTSFAAHRSAQGGYTGGFLFETAFDYGEYDDNEPWLGEVKEWNYRPDAFSSYRSGFEVRTTRLCRRVLLFHHIPDDGERKGYEGLVSSLQLGYNSFTAAAGEMWKEQKQAFDAARPHIFTQLNTFHSVGYKKDEDGSYTSKATPEAVFSYQPHTWDLSVKTFDAESLSNLPEGIDNRKYIFTDLWSEGLSGILSEQNGALYYKENLGKGKFAPARPVFENPSFKGLSSGHLQLADLDADGRHQLVSLGSPVKGFFEAGEPGRWEPFRTFDQLPNIDWNDPSLRLIDLNGDGRPDILITGDDVFSWYPSEGRKGFREPQKLPVETSEEKGPVLLFSDSEQRIFLADMSGDGLTDLVRIRNGEICYWPNLGYGRFGAKVNMDNAPVLDSTDMFSASRILLADIDGSGVVDLLYSGNGQCFCWFNLSGNAWTKTPVKIPLPRIDDHTTLSVADLMGNGTACLVWSSPLPAQAGRQICYIDLMGGIKPHLINRFDNGMGGVTQLHFRSSTSFYLEDKEKGKPWLTRLPFPIHCLARTTVRDLVRNTVFESTHTYHHGYYDHAAREFRGFGRVEQRDTETFKVFSRNDAGNVLEEIHHQPPVRIVTWFHTGAEDGKKLLDGYESEYFHNEIHPEYILPAPGLPAGLTAEEYREAIRALKGFAVRQETYADDDSPKASIPYTTSRATRSLMLIQPKGTNRYPSFLAYGGESITYLYDRNPGDPQVAHALVLENNELGQPLASAAVVYPRRVRPGGINAVTDRVWQEQNKIRISAAASLYTNDVNDLDAQPDDYRLRVPYDAKGYELLGYQFTGTPFTRQQLLASLQGAEEIPFDGEESGRLEKRLSSYTKTIFRSNDLAEPLPEGTIQSLGIGYTGREMVFTEGLLLKHYGAKVTEAMMLEAGYEPLTVNGVLTWWVPGGTALYPADAAAQFYMPHGSRDAMGSEAFVTYDAFRLAVVSTTDPAGNSMSAVTDYRAMSVVLVTDVNGNRAAAEIDELGRVVRSAVMGKEGRGEGDTLDEPTAEQEYFLFNWKDHRKPNYVRSRLRQQHGAGNTAWQESYAYSDGSGNVIMTKAQAKPGRLPQNGDDREVPRWIGNGRTVFNNKGNPVKQYKPYFSATPDYEDDPALVETGLSSVCFYDPAGRNYRTDNPDGTFTKTEFNSWFSRSYDANDTVRDSKWYLDLGSPDPAGPEPLDPARRAAWLAARHHNTPGVTHVDNLGRPIYTISDYGNGKTAATYVETDMLGRYVRLYDQKNRLVSTSYVNMAGQAIYNRSAEKGETRSFTDIIGRLVRVWDNNDRAFYTTYDELNRAVSAYAVEGGKTTLFHHTVYGDQLPGNTAWEKNLKGVPVRVYDQSGVVEIKSLDFKGMPSAIERRLAKEYKAMVDWKVLEGLTDPAAVEAAAVPLLEDEVFRVSGTYDALGRPLSVTLPDGTVMRPTYSVGNTLEKLEAQLRGTGSFVSFLQGQDHDAMGQRQFVEYGNGIVTKYFYDPVTFRLQQLLTVRKGEDASAGLQNLRYFYDPVGNIVRLEDAAQQTHFFANSVVSAAQSFEYDALYRLTRATGREHAALNQPAHGSIGPFTPVPHLNNENALVNYTESYEYDDTGNILRMKHYTGGKSAAAWVRSYQYAFDTDPSNNTNRLIATNTPGDQSGGTADTQYAYDGHGNMTMMPHLQAMYWNVFDQLRQADLGGGGMAYYTYSGQGQRTRKIIERPGGRKLERIYLGAVEIYRERWNNDAPDLERWTLHISDDSGRIAQVDIKTVDTNNSDADNALNTPLIRYQYSNHTHSSVLETDAQGVVISYEEYHPYGTSAYRIGSSASGLSLKRYRFAGKEQDNETGFYHFGVRYYAPWLGRWTSTDPAGFVDGMNLYRYCQNSPIMLHDPDGRQSRPTRRIPGSGNDHLTADSSFEERVAFAARRGWRMVEPHPEQQRWEGGNWHMSSEGYLERIAPGSGEGGGQSSATPITGSAGATTGAAERIRMNPEGFTLELPNSFDDVKMTTYRERVTTDRGVGNRSAVPGERRRASGSDVTDQLRHENRGLQRTWERDNRATRPPGDIDTDHTTELQHIIRRRTGPGATNPVGANVVRPQDFRHQDADINGGQGSDAMHTRRRAVANGAPEDTSAGGVARTSEMGLLRNRQGFRTAMRWGSYAMMGLGPVMTGIGAYYTDNNYVRGAAGLAAAGEAGGAGYYFYARFAMGGAQGYMAVPPGTALPAAQTAMRLGGRIALGAGGAGQFILSGYSAYQEFKSGDYVAAGFDTAAALGGIALMAAAVVTAPAWATGLAIAGVVTGIAAGVFHLGRFFEWW